MPILKSHIDNFTLLRLVVGEATRAEEAQTSTHLEACRRCQRAVSQLRQVDRGLRRLASKGLLDAPLSASDLPDGDSFRLRPTVATSRSPRRSSAPLEATTLRSEAISQQEQLLEAVAGNTAARAVESLDLGDPSQRLALLYALQESGRRIAESPERASAFAAAAISRLDSSAHSADSNTLSDTIAPWFLLWGQAHVLAAQGYLWAKDFKRAGSSLRVAYHAFGKTGDETGLAVTELNESQRRSFVGLGQTALVLAARARKTFEERGLDDLAARAVVAEGLAHFDLGEHEQAVAAYRASLPVFERYALWSNFVGATNSIATSLVQLGRLDEARREYARALRRFSGKEHRSWQGFLRVGIAEILFAAGRFQEAARSAAAAGNVFADCGLRANALIVWLLEIECWAKSGDIGRSQSRLDAFFRASQDEKAINPSVRREIERAVTGAKPHVDQLAKLRSRLGDELLRVAARA